MKLNEAGISLIKTFEQCRLRAYPDPATGNDPWTIGWGATGPDVKPGVIWTQDQADKRLATDLELVCNKIMPMIKTPLTDNQFSALVSFAYNLGEGHLHSSALLKLINSGDVTKAANEFPKWDKAAGKEMPGLLRRRLAEQRLFKA